MEPAVVVRIHPGQWRSSGKRAPRAHKRVARISSRLIRVPARLALLLTLAAIPASGAAGPVFAQSEAAAVVPPDSSDVLDAARDLQSRFERRRLRDLPKSASRPSGGDCDKVIGRLCIWDGGDDGWTPRPEPLPIVERRAALIAELDSLGGSSPGDAWILGQRVRYRIEAGDVQGAAQVARGCRVAARWTCDALVGLALHQAGRFEGAERAFQAALDAMPPEESDRWRAADLILGAAVKDVVKDAPDSAAAMARIWRWSDPLFMVPGNERWTGHLARWAYAMTSERTRSPHQLRWGKDLTEVVVRYGWPIAWERPWPSPGERQAVSAIGHDPPAAVRFVPAADILQPDRDADSGGPWTDWETDRKGMESLYLPPYTDSVSPLAPQFAAVRGPDGITFLAAARLDSDARGLEQVEAALAYDDEKGGRALEGAGVDAEGVVRVALPTGSAAVDGVLSLEALDTDVRWAGRARARVRVPAYPPDLVWLSDVILLDAPGDDPTRDDLPALLRASLTVEPSEALDIAFEVYGLGHRQEAVAFQVWLERADRGIVSRAVGWLGFGGDGEANVVSWTEPAPAEPTALFRTLRLTLPSLESGAYDLVVTVQTPGRTQAERRRRIQVR